MAGKVLNKMMGFLGLEDELDEEFEEVENQDNQDEDKNLQPEIGFNKKTNKVVSIHTASNVKVAIVKPKTFEEAADICDDLKNRKIIVINTTGLEHKIAQRLLDFMGGASYALSGDLQEIESGVYILSPSNVDVSNELKSQLSSKGLFNFNK
ncbi:cell division protein SepF [Clostridium acetireducens DSM 10703]|jgi:cell division inhibitor SepF|uniref:Cell division protein SepF n=1 Tax=Clostridium acetireducens DSM 10703 TaxID=1121290 RepID=A0A1E8F1M9_9CLOT|nr:cell division protein SepF [Clostridium acetireducens]OFI07557.1 cell division protein SepF [Clostridium acetireducens DSM 10703]